MFRIFTAFILSLTIGSSALAQSTAINGTIEGDLVVEHFLELQANARVTGNITYRQLQLECGATVDGKLLCAPEGTAAAPAGPAALQLAAPPAVQDAGLQPISRYAVPT